MESKYWGRVLYYITGNNKNNILKKMKKESNGNHSLHGHVASQWSEKFKHLG